tara:strand:- start:11824 stop:12171 length:348 start_codon:yes stop_codon:yes gene_type:complete
MTKRGYNTKEAMAYLGVQRRFFERHIAQLLDGKGVRAGTSIIFEKQDLDDAWERYKLLRGSERVQPKGNMKWRHDHVDNGGSPRTLAANGKSIASTEVRRFASVVSQITGRQKIS